MKRILIPASDLGYFRLLLDLALSVESQEQTEQEYDDSLVTDSYDNDSNDDPSLRIM